MELDLIMLEQNSNEKEWERQQFQYLKTSEDQFKAIDKRYEKYLKIKTDENQFKKRYLNLCEGKQNKKI